MLTFCFMTPVDQSAALRYATENASLRDLLRKSRNTITLLQGSLTDRNETTYIDYPDPMSEYYNQEQPPSKIVLGGEWKTTGQRPLTPVSYNNMPTQNVSFQSPNMLIKTWRYWFQTPSINFNLLRSPLRQLQLVQTLALVGSLSQALVCQVPMHIHLLTIQLRNSNTILHNLPAFNHSMLLEASFFLVHQYLLAIKQQYTHQFIKAIRLIPTAQQTLQCSHTESAITRRLETVVNCKISVLLVML
jgi:hypothetical protein